VFFVLHAGTKTKNIPLRTPALELLLEYTLYAFLTYWEWAKLRLKNLREYYRF